MRSLIRYSEVTIVELVSEPSVLVGIAAANLQDYLLYSRSFAHNHTQIYSPHNLLCLDEKCAPNKST